MEIEMTYSEMCAEKVADYGYLLASKVRLGELNASAVDGLIESYLDQPAYRLEDGRKLKEIGLRFL